LIDKFAANRENVVMTTKGRIIVADDDPDITGLLQKLLTGEGYSVVAVNDGDAALAAYDREKPDLMVLDWSMPGQDGLQVCAEVRKKDSRVLLLMLTGQKTEQKKVAGLAGGADDYITKPFGQKEFLARIRSLFRRLDV
jgi:DNA-binding response OmpR family regulator